MTPSIPETDPKALPATTVTMQPRDVGEEEASWIRGRALAESPATSIGTIVTRLVRLRHIIAERAERDSVLKVALEVAGLDWPSDPASR